MTCAKRRVQCLIRTRQGDEYTGENHCENPQETCPREPGEGYEKCRSVCRQRGHAETNALAAAARAGANLRDATATVYNHYRICLACETQLRAAGVAWIQTRNYCLLAEES